MYVLNMQSRNQRLDTGLWLKHNYRYVELIRYVKVIIFESCPVVVASVV